MSLTPHDLQQIDQLLNKQLAVIQQDVAEIRQEVRGIKYELQKIKDFLAIHPSEKILFQQHLTCPKCNSTATSETVTLEQCHSCGFQQDYHAWNHQEPDFIRH